MRAKFYSLLLVAAGAFAGGCTTYVDTDHPGPVVVETKPRDKVDVDVNLPPRSAERPQRKIDVDVNAPGVDVDVKR
jgi:hypothetical protein